MLYFYTSIILLFVFVFSNNDSKLLFFYSRTFFFPFLCFSLARDKNYSFLNELEGSSSKVGGEGALSCMLMFYIFYGILFLLFCCLSEKSASLVSLEPIMNYISCMTHPKAEYM